MPFKMMLRKLENRPIRLRAALLGASLALLILAAGLLVQQAYAHRQTSQAALVSPLHPTFLLLDKDGKNVLESGAPLSPEQTCGQCHDTAYITSHGFHFDLGASEQTPAGQAPGGQPWDTSPGL